MGQFHMEASHWPPLQASLRPGMPAASVASAQRALLGFVETCHASISPQSPRSSLSLPPTSFAPGSMHQGNHPPES